LRRRSYGLGRRCLQFVVIGFFADRDRAGKLLPAAISLSSCCERERAPLADLETSAKKRHPLVAGVANHVEIRLERAGFPIDDSAWPVCFLPAEFLARCNRDQNRRSSVPSSGNGAHNSFRRRAARRATQAPLIPGLILANRGGEIPT